ncbi:DUF397 domain-containing protein [Streptomyces sp. SCSIO 75703]|uniref:DUF397 domain-containing protein n=1 Tax=Streptomyces sp. SCSIO 75703 TaxID=3112165 RepID=UPI0030D32C71
MHPNSSIDLNSVQWRTSSYSSGNGGECVEVATGPRSLIPVRDSKNPEGPVLLIGARAWAPFLSGLKSV